MSEADAGDNGLVWVLPGNRGSRTYHTDESCHMVRDGHMQKRLEVLHGDMEICPYCDGQGAMGGNDGPSFRQKLEAGEIEI